MYSYLLVLFAFLFFLAVAIILAGYVRRFFVGGTKTWVGRRVQVRNCPQNLESTYWRWRISHQGVILGVDGDKYDPEMREDRMCTVLLDGDPIPIIDVLMSRFDIVHGPPQVKK